MTDEMLVAQAQWLPQYRKAVAAAKKRLAKGPLIPTKKNYKGAARLRMKTLAEIRRLSAKGKTRRK